MGGLFGWGTIMAAVVIESLFKRCFGSSTSTPDR